MQTTPKCIQRSQLSTDCGRELSLLLSHTAPASSHRWLRPLEAHSTPEAAKIKLSVPEVSKQNHPTAGRGTP